MDLQQPLTDLEKMQLVRRLDDADLAYLFKHTLIQESVYSSLLKNDRKRLHRLIGESLERSYSDSLNEIAPRIAQHYAEAGDAAKTLTYATLAGDAAAQTYANAEAIMHYSTALEVAKHLSEQKASEETLTHLYAQRGRAYELSNRYAEALDNYMEMEAIARARGFAAMELAALLGRNTLYATFTPLHNPVEARRTSERALELARQRHDRAAESKILWNLSLVATYGEADHKRAIEYGEQSLAIARELNLREQMARSLNDLFYPFVSARPLYQTQQLVSEAEQLWRELDNQPMLVDSLVNGALVLLQRGEYQRTIDKALQAFEIAESTNNLWGQCYALMQVGEAYFELGDPGSAIMRMAQCLQIAHKANFNPPFVMTRSDLAWTYARLGAFEHAIALSKEAVSFGDRVLPYFANYTNTILVRSYLRAGRLADARAIIEHEPCILTEEQGMFIIPILVAHRDLALSEYDVTQQKYDAANERLNRLLAYLNEREVRIFVADTYQLQAHIYLLQNQLDQAADKLEQARVLSLELGVRWQLWQIYAALADLATRRSDPNQANEWRAKARTELEYILNHTPADLRASFSNLPNVKTIIAPERNTK